MTLGLLSDHFWMTLSLCRKSRYLCHKNRRADARMDYVRGGRLAADASV